VKLDVTAQVKLPGSVGKARLSEPFADIEFGGRRISFARPLDIEVTYVYDGESFAVAGTISAVFNSQCARCGEPFEEPLTFEFKERFVRDELEDEDVYTFTSDVLDLTAMIQDNILLNMPMRSVCSASCKGKCPVCGCNLNFNQCPCDRQTGEDTPRKNPFADLRSLLNDDKEV
jgi:uncharacterized protein